MQGGIFGVPGREKDLNQYYMELLVGRTLFLEAAALWPSVTEHPLTIIEHLRYLSWRRADFSPLPHLILFLLFLTSFRLPSPRLFAVARSQPPPPEAAAGLCARC